MGTTTNNKRSELQSLYQVMQEFVDPVGFTDPTWEDLPERVVRLCNIKIKLVDDSVIKSIRGDRLYVYNTEYGNILIYFLLRQMARVNQVLDATLEIYKQRFCSCLNPQTQTVDLLELQQLNDDIATALC